MKKMLCISFLMLFSSKLLAYGVFNGTVKDVRVDRGGWGIIAFDGPITGEPPSCRKPGYSSHMSFDANTEGGKAIYAMALAAAASGKLVYVIGLGSCSDYADIVESLSYMHIIK